MINEVYVNGGSTGATYTNKYVELRNLTGADINLAGMSVQYRAPGSSGNSTSTAALTGTIPANGYYTVAGGSNGSNGTAVPTTPGQTSTGINPGAAGGTITLVTGTTAVDPSSSTAVVDKVGWGTSNTPEGTATGGNSVTMSMGRSGGSVDTDANATDFSAQTPTPGASNGGGSAALAATNPGNKTYTTNQAITSFSLAATGGTSPYTWATTALPAGLTLNGNTISGTPTATGTTSVTATVTDSTSATASTTFSITVNAPGALAVTNPGDKTAQVGTAITPFTIAATGGTSPYTWSQTGLPAGLTLNATSGQVSGTPTAASTGSVTATATDAANATASTTFTYTVTAANAVTPIAQIQGTNTATSPLAGTTVTTEGVVTAMYPTGGFAGMYIQTGGTGGTADATPGASDAIFVYGANSMPTGVAIGDSVRVTGPVSEFAGTTEITPAAGGVTKLTTALPAVTPATIAYPTTEAGREAREGELLAPTGPFTVSNVYNIDGGATAYAEIGLASGTTPLQQPTDVVDAQTGNTAAITADNAARGVALDDGSSLNFMAAANTSLPLPWVTNNPNPPRMGAQVTFTGPVILEYRNNIWKFQPTSQITDTGASTATFGTDRAANAQPADVGGDLKLSTFNVLNYFPTTGEAHVAAGGTCSYYTDRAGNRIANNTCNPDGPRGAATTVSLQRQQSKIVNAINKLGADIVSLEEIENSVKMIGQTDRDNGVRTLVNALNAAAGSTRWAFAPSPPASELPTLAEQDVIRTAFIYNPATVSLVGASQVLTTASAFNNAREPLAQAFKPIGTADSEAFGVIVNHFKSKGSGTDDGTGQGNANPDRIAQSQALVTFANNFKTARNVDAVFLAGDFNSYTMEDPMQVLYDAGYTNIESDDDSDASYSFDGLAGSLDHVLGNAAAMDMVTGSDIWEINANESLAYQYSRYNYHGAITFDGTDPFAASDHNPEIIGISTDAAAAPVDVQILATNDFHGRIQNDTSSGAAGAAVLAGAVKQFKAANPATSFVAAGDLIGASTFESFIAKDKPTIDALNEAGLDVSAVGNHEFDQGYNDLVNRVMAPYNASTNPNGGAEWKYIGANVKLRDSGNPALEPSYVMDQGGIEVGYIGAVTEHLPELVAPGGISNIQVTDIPTAVNTEADALKAEGVDVIVLLVHEGAAGTSCTTINSDTTSDFGKITAGVNANVDAIVSGHTHLTYNCSQPVPAWVTEGRAVTERPVVSAGQYGTNLNKINFSVDPTTGEVLSKTQAVLPLKNGTSGSTFNYPVDTATKNIVDAAVANADVLGAQVIGKIGGAFNRAKLSDGTTENRGGESTLGNLVAEIQRAQTASAQTGSAQIAFMNPGGLRADLAGTVNGASRDITYKQAATVQPFANTLVNEALTGAQIKAALEQQWQPAGASRPFLKLGISKGFTYTYDPTAAAGSRITSMTLNGTPIDLAATYSVTVNSFLSTGGDNFTALNGTARKQDTGVTDLQAQVDYFAALGTTTPAPVDYSQRAVGVRNLTATPTGGENVSFDLSSLSMTGPGDTVDTSVTVTMDGAVLGTAPVTTTVLPALPGDDEAGTASVMVPLPTTASGAKTLVVTGNNTGTETRIPIDVTPVPKVAPTLTVSASPATVQVHKGSIRFVARVNATGFTPTGTVQVKLGNRVVASGTLNAAGAVSIPMSNFAAVGRFAFTVAYLGDDRTESVQRNVVVRVVKQTPSIKVTAPKTVKKGFRPFVRVALTGVRAKVTGKVTFTYAGKKVTRTLKAGKAAVRLPKVNRATTVTVKYLGAAKFNQVTRKATIRIKR